MMNDDLKWYEYYWNFIFSETVRDNGTYLNSSSPCLRIGWCEWHVSQLGSSKIVHTFVICSLKNLTLIETFIRLSSWLHHIKKKLMNHAFELDTGFWVLLSKSPGPDHMQRKLTCHMPHPWHRFLQGQSTWRRCSPPLRDQNLKMCQTHVNYVFVINY